MSGPTASPGAVPVVLDVDTGVDDALALLYAHAEPRLQVRAVTCVGGNTDLDHVLANTRAVLAVAGLGTAVHAGHPHPLEGPAVELGERWHGQDGLMGCRPDAETLAALDVPGLDPEPAVEAIARHARAGGGRLVLVPLGPLTNAADLLRRHPDAVAALARVHLMGGSGAGGNITPAAEFNVHHDPHAADVVIRGGAPVTMYGLDVFERVRVPAAEVADLVGSDVPALALAGRLLAASARRQGREDAGLGDAGAVAALARPDLVTVRARPVAVQVGAGPARGETVVDRRGPGHVPGDGFREVDVVEEVDAVALAAHVVQALRAAYA